MKKSFKLFAAALMVLAIVVPAQANELLTVCNDTRTSAYVPFKNGDFQSTSMHSQLIYPASMIAEMNGQPINSLTFYLQQGLMAQDGQLIVKMGETDNPIYATGQDFRTGLVQVAAMPLTSGITELVIDFSTPYNYQGGNLVLDFTVGEAGDENFYGWNYWYGQQQSGYTAIGSDGLLNNFLPKATFDYGIPQEWAAKVSPLGLDFNLPAEREEVQYITVLNKGLNPFTPVLSTLHAPLSIEVEPVELATGESLVIPVKFAPTEVCNCFAYLTIDCGQAGSFEIVINAVATEPIYEVVVGSTATSGELLPFYTYYFDEEGTFGQMIYTEEMMGAVKGNKITKVTFHPTRALLSSVATGIVQLSFKNVGEQLDFGNATAVTDLTAQATYTFVGGETELTFVLDEPYQYDGGSLAIEAMVLQRAETFSRNSFYGNNYSNYPSFYHYKQADSIEGVSNFLPMTTFTYDKVQVQPEVIRGDVNGDKLVTITDVTALITILMNNLEAPAGADCDGQEGVSIRDVTALITYLMTQAWPE